MLVKNPKERRSASAPIRIGLLATLLCLVASVAPAAEPLGEQTGGLVHAGDKPSLFLMYTGDVIGYVDTCGCKRNPAGGIPRRTWVVKRVDELFPGVPRILVDSGNFSDNPTPAGDVKTKALLEAMGTLGYAAANVGERDLRTGYDDLMSRAEEIEFPLLSANIVQEESGEPVFEPSHVVEIERLNGAPIRVGLIGVARYNPMFLKAGPDDTNLVIDRPDERVRAEVQKLQAEKTDLIVLLAALHKEEAKRLVNEIPGIDYVVGAYAGQITQNGERVDKSWLLYSGNQGKRLGETRVYFDQYGRPERQRTTMHFLTRDYPPDQDSLDWLRSLELPADDAGLAGGAR